jgi:PAS domain S-box-containing protein
MRTLLDRLRRYGFALLTLALTAVVMGIPGIEDRAGTAILVYFFAVLLSAWYGGLGPGLLTTAVIVLMTSHTTFPFWRVMRLGLGIASGISISALAEVLHAARRRAERNEQRFRALIENGRDVISVVSDDGVVRYASPTVAHTLGHAPEDLVGRDALELIHPDDRGRVGLLLDELRWEPGASRVVDYRVRDKGGTWLWLEGTVTNLLTDPAVGGMVCNVRDITGRKKAEEALRESEARYRMLFERNQSGVLRSAEDGRILDCNDSLARMLGYGSREEVLALTVWDLYHRRADRRAVLARLRERAMLTDFEVRARRRDGGVAWLLGSLLRLEGAGDEAEYHATVIDITERKRAEEAQQLLAEAGAVLSSSLDDGPTLEALARLAVRLLADLCLIDMVQDDGTVIRAAAAHADPAKQALADELRRYPPDPQGPHPAMRALRSGRAEVADEVDDAVLAAAARDSAHLEVVRRLGFTSYLCIPLTARGRALGVLNLVSTGGHRRYDAADRALAEELARRAALAVDNARLYRAARQARQEAEAADRAKGRFLAVLSHELRTPLSPVLMAVSALLDGDETLDLRPTLEMIRRNVELEARLIDDLLDVTRIGRGTLHLDLRTVDAHDAVRHAVQICLGEIEQGGIALGSDLTAAEHHVEADPARLRQIIWNLIKNATKFTPPGGSIAVRSRNRPPQGPGGRPRLVIEVADDGGGIEAEALTRIFEPFEQGDVSPRHRSGLGLGLAIGRSLAEAHGGRLTAASPGPGRGSIFVLELPTTSRPAAVKPPSVSATPPLPRSRGLKVLLVEDNKDTLKYIALVLGARGHEVTVAERLSEALRAAADQPFDLLVSDIELPDGTGLELMRQLRGRGLPAIAMSGYGSEEDVRASQEAGFTEHLTKPVDLTRLLAAVHSVTAAERGARAEEVSAAARTS